MMKILIHIIMVYVGLVSLVYADSTLWVSDTNLCDEALGAVEVELNEFSCFGSSIANSSRHHYNLADDLPDQGFVNTVFEASPNICIQKAQGQVSQAWFKNFEGTQLVSTEIQDGVRFTRMLYQDVMIVERTWLNCHRLHTCYTFDNQGDVVIDQLGFYTYIDPDLFFGDNGLSNDKATVFLGDEVIVSSFDENYAYLSMSTTGSEQITWEVGSFSELRNRIGQASTTCDSQLLNRINRAQVSTDQDGDGVSDMGYDTSMALFHPIGSLAVNEGSREVCIVYEWAAGLPSLNGGIDLDGDGITYQDNCPEVYNPQQRDMDGNGVADACQFGDSDGIDDAIDNCVSRSNVEQSDLDGDGIGDACDDDIDGDGIENEEDLCVWLDDPNQNCLLNHDEDQDGIDDGIDNCVLRFNQAQTDIDGDGIGDACDDDVDGDGVLNANDLCPLTANADQSDLDEDGVGNVCDEDIDGDGLINLLDHCVYDSRLSGDLDGDGIGNVCDEDLDGDGVLNEVDNCINIANEFQQDRDADGIGDVCEIRDGLDPQQADTDQDGVEDGMDNCPLDLNPMQEDLDGDGVGSVCDEEEQVIRDDMRLIEDMNLIVDRGGLEDGRVEQEDSMQDMSLVDLAEENEDYSRDLQISDEIDFVYVSDVEMFVSHEMILDMKGSADHTHRETEVLNPQQGCELIVNLHAPVWVYFFFIVGLLRKVSIALYCYIK